MTPILVVGGSGQIGHVLRGELASLGRVLAPSRGDLDLDNTSSIRDFLTKTKPGLVVNAAAYTAVDRAETEPEACARINADAPGALAEACHDAGSALVHFSTDYVFDGESTVPYVETNSTSPLNVYGKTKLAGEQAIATAGGAHLIFRTSWIYSARGQNFALTMLRLAHERDELRVVNDQVGAPTSARAVARGVADVLRSLPRRDTWFKSVGDASGVYHMSASGSTTWYEFARRILADDPRRSDQKCHTIRPISSADYPTPARRPRNSLLDNSKLDERFGVRLPSWTEQWEVVASELRLRETRAS